MIVAVTAAHIRFRRAKTDAGRAVLRTQTGAKIDAHMANIGVGGVPKNAPWAIPMWAAPMCEYADLIPRPRRAPAFVASGVRITYRGAKLDAGLAVHIKPGSPDQVG